MRTAVSRLGGREAESNIGAVLQVSSPSQPHKPCAAQVTSSMARPVQKRRPSSLPKKRVCRVAFCYAITSHILSVIPIVGDTLDTSRWVHLIPTLDAIIDSTSGPDVKTIGETLLRAVTDAVGQHRPPHAPKITYVYTSGVLVHGDSRKDIVNDTTPITSPSDFVAWRPAFEQTVLTSTAVNGIVVRPSYLYGRSGSLTAILFGSAYKGRARWYGKPGGRASLIHQDDLADFYVRVIERGQLVKGLAFDVSNPVTESMDDILARLTEVSGAREPYEYVAPTTRE